MKNIHIILILFAFIMAVIIKKKSWVGYPLSWFASADGSQVPKEFEENTRLLAKNIAVLEKHLGVKIRNHSAYRSDFDNERVGGKPNSWHKKAGALDFSFPNLTHKYVQAQIEVLISARKMTQGGLGKYPNFTHYDIQGVKRRWSS